MREFFSVRDRHSKDHGVFLFLGAVLIIALISSVMLLGYYSIQSKRVTALLRKNADTICQEIAYAPMLPERAWNTFQELVANTNLHHGHITSARLVLPLMPETISNPPFCATRNDSTTVIGSCGEGIACTLETSVCSNNRNISYPPSIWKTPRDIGSAVGCELTAKLNPLGTGLFAQYVEDEIVDTKVIWHRPLFHASDGEEQSAIEDPDTAWPNFPFGLTLIISPHMTTYGGLRRFQFSDSEESLRFPQ
ncbi:MAG: hypothetical protein KDD55_12860, partial [Bdellovibrionales bacterium]|nr:hypothetical protein [Bdellovibrionales bacterium]